MSNNECSVLVVSCDKYEEAWYPFFTLLKKYWHERTFPLYLSTETKQYFDSDVTVLNTDSKSWGERVSSALSRIDSEYVIVLLEDFFIRKKIDSDEISKCIELMHSDEKIAVFYFSRVTGYNTDSKEYEKYFHMHPEEQTNRYGRYMINCQAALWRKRVLIEAVKNSETPWNLEEDAYLKLSEDIKNMKYYCLKNAWYDEIREDDVFSYILVRDKGYGIWQSKWLWNNKKLFKKEGIKVKFKTLGKISKFAYDFEVFKQKVNRRLERMMKK